MSGISEHHAAHPAAIAASFAEPDGFVFQHLVRIFVQQQVFWQPTLCNARLVSRAWHRGVSHAVEVLAPRPSISTTQLAHLPRIFPNLKLLRVQRPVLDAAQPIADLVDQDGALLALANSQSGLSSSLSALHLLVVKVGPRGVAALPAFQSLSFLEVEASGDGCLAALRALRGCPALRHLRVRPTTSLARLSACRSREYKYGSDLISQAAQLTGLCSLACSAAGASSSDITQLAALRHLSKLELQDVPLASVAGLAEVAPALRQLAFSFEYSTARLPQPAGSWAMPDIGALLPLSSLAGLQSLSAPFELFPSPRALSLLAGLTKLEVDFGAARLGILDEDDSMSCDAACVALLRRLPNLRALRLFGAEVELSRHSLAELSVLAPTLTSLEIHQCHNLENEVMGAIGRLQHLQRLRLSGTAFDGEGLEALGRLQALTWLVLDNCAGVLNTWELAEAVARVTLLRFLHLRGHPYMTRPTLDLILTSLPALGLLQTTWRPTPPSDLHAAPQGLQSQIAVRLQQLQLRLHGQEASQGQGQQGQGGRPTIEEEEDDASWCRRWQFVLQHSLDQLESYMPGKGFWEFDARRAAEAGGRGVSS